MTDFVDPVVIAQINAAKDTLVTEVARLGPSVTKIENYAGALDSVVPEAPIDGKLYGRKDATWTEVTGGGGGDAVWGGITGTLSDQTDLQSALNAKANDSAISTVGKTGQYADLLGKPAVIPEAPVDNKQYARKNAAWEEVSATLPTNPVLNGITNFKVSTSGNVFTDIATNGDSFGFQTPDAFDEPYYRGYKCDANGMAVYVGGVLFGRVLKGLDVPAADNKQYVRKNQGWSELVAPAVTWGTITGTLSAQTDLQNALNAKADTTALATKQDTLVSGTNIKTINGNSILGSGDLVISGGGAGSKFEAIYADAANYIEQNGNADGAAGVRYTIPLATMKTWFNKQVRLAQVPVNFSGALKIYSFSAPDATVNYGDCFTVIMSSTTIKQWSDFEFGAYTTKRFNTAAIKYDDGSTVASGDGGNFYFEFVCAKVGLSSKAWLLRSYVAY